MEYNISNIKLSFKISLSPLDIVEETLQKSLITYKKYHNYIVFKVSKFHCVLFKENIKNDSNHLNVTKINFFSEISVIRSQIESLFSCSIKSEHIDNIMATSQYKQVLDLNFLARNSLCNIAKYNPETFPGLFIKFKEGTMILFHSGKIVIVGCKQEIDIQCLLQKLIVLISMR